MYDTYFVCLTAQVIHVKLASSRKRGARHRARRQPLLGHLGREVLPAAAEGPLARSRLAERVTWEACGWLQMKGRKPKRRSPKKAGPLKRISFKVCEKSAFGFLEGSSLASQVGLQLSRNNTFPGTEQLQDMCNDVPWLCGFS